MDSGEATEILIKPTVSLWSNLSSAEQIKLRNEAIARFPEIFGRSSTKYQKLASWLAARHGIVDASLRDRFSAGGKVNLTVGGTIYKSLPRVFLHLKTNAHEIIECVKKLTPEEAKHYWDLSSEPTSIDQLLSEWTKQLIFHSGQLFYDSEKFIIHLLGISFSDVDCPSVVKERRAHYGIKE
ncbi:MAG: hypothetical protein QUS13_06270 [Smithella sp.]|nr:hypothetical protein [Smithella sp.]